MKFTDRGIAALKPDTDRYEVWEDGRTGFGVRVSQKGRKSWVYMYRFNGSARRLTLDTYPAMPLAEARVRVADAKRKLAHGEDPGIQHLEEMRMARGAPTIETLVEDYLEHYARPRKRSAREDERILRKDVVPAWRGTKAHGLTRRHVSALLERIVARGAPIQANRTLAVVRKMFNFAISRGVIEASPCLGVAMPAKENQRDRVLSDAEIIAFWKGIERPGISEEVQLALKLQLVTAQRKMEVSSAEWNEFDLEQAIWTIPKDRAKNGRASRVPLSPLAVQIVTRLRELHPDSPYPFPSRNKRTAITSRAIDRAVGRFREELGIDHFTPHDLRRTAASHMTMLGFNRLIVEKILNHADNSVAAIYDRYGYDKEKRDALDAWSEKLSNLVSR